MARGFDSMEQKGLERAVQNSICEGYACVDLATVRVGNQNFCRAHQPKTSLATRREVEDFST